MNERLVNSVVRFGSVWFGYRRKGDVIERFQSSHCWRSGVLDSDFQCTVDGIVR